MMVRRGKQPRDIDWRRSEKAAEIMVWLATQAAAVAIVKKTQ